MGMSRRAYAKHRGISEAAVRKALSSGRITLEADGKIDPDKADQQWQANTNQSQQRAKSSPNVAVEAPSDTLNDNSIGSGNTTYMQARVANEVLKAQTARLKLQQQKNELVDRDKALSHVFKLARAERDAWLSWPSRISSQMAADLNIDAHLMHVTLEKYVREHLNELADIKPKID